MLFCEISRILARYLLMFSIVLCIPLGVGIYFQFIAAAETHPQPHATLSFFITLLISLALAGLCKLLGRKSSGTLYRKEGILAVVIIYCISILLSSVPFMLSKTLTNPIDAIFEATSGLTTTGATVIAAKTYDANGAETYTTVSPPNQRATSYQFYGNITPLKDGKGQLLTGLDAVARSLIFWRGFLQWVGGVGIIVLFIIVLPALSMGGKFLYELEMPGPEKGGLSPRIKDTAITLLKIYLTLTLFACFAIKCAKPALSIFETICLGMSTISTGGFTPTSTSLTGYQNRALEVIFMVFMFLGSVSFVCYSQIVRGRLRKAIDPELKMYLGLLIFFIFLMTCNLWHHPISLLDPSQGTYSFHQALYYGTFQVISATTSTGISNANYDVWPMSSQLLLVLLTYVGGMSGSTSGGIKISRHMILLRAIIHKIESIFRPETIRVLRIGEREIAHSTISMVLIFICTAVALSVIGTYIYVLQGLDPDSAVQLISSLVNNAGLSFGGADSSLPYTFLPPFSKVIGIIWMVLGRLEFFSILVLFVPAFWEK